MAQYLYAGPDSGITLNTGTKDRPNWQDVLLRNGGTVELPEQHEAVQTLLAQGYLQAVPAADAAKPATAAKGGTKE